MERYHPRGIKGELATSMRNQLCAYFETRLLGDRVADELPYQLKLSHDWPNDDLQFYLARLQKRK